MFPQEKGHLNLRHEEDIGSSQATKGRGSDENIKIFEVKKSSTDLKTKKCHGGWSVQSHAKAGELRF